MDEIRSAKDIEFSLDEFHQIYKAYSENSIVAITDANGTILKVNRMFSEISGYSKAELVGKNHRILNSGYHGDEFFKEMYKTIHSGKVWKGDIRNKTKDGNYYWVETLIIPILDQNERIHRLFTVRTLISDRIFAQQKVEELLKEKEILLTEVHHRIKNNMYTIYTLLLLQASRIDDNLHSKQALEDAASRVQSMMLLYNQLYQSPDHQKINLKNYLEVLAQNILIAFPDMVYFKLVMPDNLELDSRIASSFAIIFNELVTNSLKYAKTESQILEISLHSTFENSKLTSIYRDNGLGFPSNLSFESSSGFGFTLINLLTKQLKGSIDIQNRNPLEITISFPIN
jgi:PAS domain S-box-containing protein